MAFFNPPNCLDRNTRQLEMGSLMFKGGCLTPSHPARGPHPTLLIIWQKSAKQLSPAGSMLAVRNSNFISD